MRLVLRLEGIEAAGFCEDHGAYSTPWKREVVGGVSGVLAGICPDCARNGEPHPSFSIANQSLPRYAPIYLSSAPSLIRCRIPLIVLDALDLACLSDIGNAPLTELRGAHILNEAKSLAEAASPDVQEALISIVRSAFPIGVPGGRATLTMRFHGDEGVQYLNNFCQRVELPLATAISGLCLFAWVSADEALVKAMDGG